MTKGFIFITPNLYPDKVGGAEVFNYYLIKHLSKTHPVKYLSNALTDIEGAKKVRLPKLHPIIQHIFIFLHCLFCKNRLIISSFMRTKWYYVLFMPMLSILARKDYTIIIHGGGITPWEYNWPYKFYFKRAIKIYGVSEKICEIYSERTGSRIEYLPPLIPFERAAIEKDKLKKLYGFECTKKIYLMVGSIKDLKRPMLVLDALKSAILKRSKPNIKLIFAGDGDLRHACEKFADENGLKEYVKFAGIIKREELPNYYAMSDIYVIASKYEGTPISMIEALFNNVPVFGAKVEGINQVFELGMIGHTFESEEELSNLFLNTFDNDEIYRKIKPVTVYEKHFNIKKIYNSIKDIN